MRNVRLKAGRWLAWVRISGMVAGMLMLVGHAGDAFAQSADNPDQPYAFATLPNVDENLFALRLLNDIYSHWPDMKGDRSNVKAWFTSAKESTARMQQQIRVRHLDPNLLTVYTDCQNYITQTENYLSAVDVLDNQKTAGTLWDVITSTYTGYDKSEQTSSTAKKLGFSDKNAADAGEMVGTVSALSDFNTKMNARGAAYRQQVAAETKKLEDRWSDTSQNLRKVSDSLTAKFGWKPGEGGFDGFKSAQIADLVNRSPRDPFLWVKYGDAVLGNAKTAEDCVKAEEAYFQAAELIPADGSYDSLRLQYLDDATQASLSAATIQSNSSYTAHPALGPYTVKMARTYLAVDPQDSTGIGHIELARALGFAGRYLEASYSAEAAYNARHDWATDPGFCIRYAKLLVLTDRTARATEWIEKAYNYGYSDVNVLRQAADFESYRAQQPQQARRLTTVAWNWKINYGNFLDDVVVMNNSPFPLTNVTFHVHITKGNEVWDKTVTCKSIKPRSSCEADNIMSITGNSYDNAQGTLTSDQGS